MTRDAASVLALLETRADLADVRGMARHGIRSAARVLGVRKPAIKALARELGRDHALALELWETGVHEARILAAHVAEPGRATPDMLEAWLGAIDNWDLCDQCCGNYFDRLPHACELAHAWSVRPEEFPKRAGFVLMAVLAVHDKAAPDATFLGFLPACEREAHDGRNFVKKAVNWALRQIGKRNLALHAAAVTMARRIHDQDTPSARWIATDALRELTGDAVRGRLRRMA